MTNLPAFVKIVKEKLFSREKTAIYTIAESSETCQTPQRCLTGKKTEFFLDASLFSQIDFLNMNSLPEIEISGYMLQNVRPERAMG